MSSPSQPITIGGRPPRSPNNNNNDGGVNGPNSSSYVPSVLDGTPNLNVNAFTNRSGSPYIGTPPVPNIPPRMGTPMQRTESIQPGEMGGAASSSPTPRWPGVSSPVPGSSVPSTRYGLLAGAPPPAPGGGGSPAPGVQPNLDLDALTDDDKARVLRRHLVLNEERYLTPRQEKPRSIAGSDLEFPSGSGSKTPRDGGPEAGTSKSSSDHATPPQQDDGVVFSIPYHAPGADVTCVKHHSSTGLSPDGDQLGMTSTNGTRTSRGARDNAPCRSMHRAMHHQTRSSSTFASLEGSDAIS